VAVALELEWPYKFNHGVFAGTQEYVRQCGRWDCVIDPAPEVTLAVENPEWAYDGVIALATPAIASAARTAGVPLVNVWHDSRITDVPLVTPDYHDAGRIAGEHLLARGFESFSYIGYTRTESDKTMIRGFGEVLSEAGMSCSRPLLIPAKHAVQQKNWQVLTDRLNEWIDGWSLPMGICSGYDLLTRYLVSTCQRKGLDVPQDVAMVSSDNEPVICNNPEPSLTSLDFGCERVGYRAAELLDEMMDGAPGPSEPLQLQTTSLVARRSSDVLAVADPIVAEALRFASEHSHEPIQVNDVARAAHVTRRTLERRFRKVLGRSIGDEIVRLRVERVKRKLAESDTPIKRLASQAGFSDARRMCKVFKRVTGVTPSTYRRQRRG